MKPVSLLLVLSSFACATEPTMTYAKPSIDQLKKKLTPEQFHVTQEAGTERAFTGELWNNHEAGLYVDVVTGEPLFSSTDKFESGTGWPSFVKPIDKVHVIEKHDVSYGMERVDKSGKWKKPVVTEIVAATQWYPAEDYHQDYLQRNPGGYTCHYLRE